MSRTHDGHHASSPFGNPFKLVFSKRQNRFPKLLTLLSSFEQSLAENIRKLKPNETTNFPSLLWLRQAVDALLESHNKLKALIFDLEFPASVWDEKWIELYLDDSLKLLDVCIALISEVSRLEQNQIFLRYALQISEVSRLEQLQRADEALHDWTQKLHLRSSKLENARSILLGMVGALSLPKVKNSLKGKVLTRALYAVKVQMMFISSVLVAVFSGCSKPLIDMQVPNDFLWADAFNELQTIVYDELRSRLSLDKLVILKELGEVDSCSKNLHGMMVLTIQKEDEKEDNHVDEVRRTYGKQISVLSKGALCLLTCNCKPTTTQPKQTPHDCMIPDCLTVPLTTQKSDSSHSATLTLTELQEITSKVSYLLLPISLCRTKPRKKIKTHPYLIVSGLTSRLPSIRRRPDLPTLPTTYRLHHRRPDFNAADQICDQTRPSELETASHTRSQTIAALPSLSPANSSADVDCHTRCQSNRR